MLLSNSITYDILIPYFPMFSPLNTTIILTCMFIYHIQKQFHTRQCIISRIIKLLCLYISEMMMNQLEQWRYIILLIPN